jgi:calcineurin-like phosphoesterase family protein
MGALLTVWFTSDTHFGHANIIRHCARPFGGVAEMDVALVANWNARVRPGDDVWHLGDFAFRNETAAASYLRRLHGRVNLIWGNHDSDVVRHLPGWASSQPMAEITVDGVRLVLLHYAMLVWPRSHHGALHLFGHSHGTLQGNSQSCDVGVDAWDYRPVSLAEIQERLATLPARISPDQHGAA